MVRSVEAIVLQLIPYKDHSAIVKLFTRESGLASCWINSLHTKSSGIRVAGLQPLSVINAIVEQRDTKQLCILKEMQIAFFTPSISNNIEKSAIAIFMAELLAHTIKESAIDELLYYFLRESILLLNNTVEKCANFHMVFMLNLSTHIGILPKNSFSSQTPYLNLEEGNYQAQAPIHTSFLFPEESACISKLSALPIESFSKAEIPFRLRKNILYGLLKYFEIHAGTTPLKSHLILEEVF